MILKKKGRYYSGLACLPCIKVLCKPPCMAIMLLDNVKKRVGIIPAWRACPVLKYFANRLVWPARY